MLSSFSFKTVFKPYFCIIFLFPISIFKVLFNSLKCQLCSPASYNISCFNLNLDFQVGTVSEAFPLFLFPELLLLWNYAVIHVFSFLPLDLCMVIIFTWWKVFHVFQLPNVYVYKIEVTSKETPSTLYTEVIQRLYRGWPSCCSIICILGFISTKVE